MNAQSWHNRVMGAYAEARRNHTGIVENDFVWVMNPTTAEEIANAIDPTLHNGEVLAEMNLMGIRVRIDDHMRPDDLWLVYTVVA